MKRRTFLKGIGTTSTAVPFVGCSILKGRDKYSNYKPKGVIQKNTLGKTGIRVSMFGFGSHLKKELIARPELRDRMIRMGYEGGINIFDVYNRGEYHQYIPMSKSIRDFRKKMLISLYAINSTDKLQWDIDYALKVFQTDYIDLYRFRPVNDEGMNIMEKNKKAGKIRAIGVAAHEAKTLMEYIDRYPNSIDYVLLVFNFHHNKAVPGKNAAPNDYSELIPRCERLGIGILGMKSMGSDNMIALAYKKSFFKDKKSNVAQAMLRFIYQQNIIDSSFAAMNSMEEVIANLESAYNPSISPYEEKLLEDLSAAASASKGAYLPDHYKWLENWSVKMA